MARVVSKFVANAKEVFRLDDMLAPTFTDNNYGSSSIVSEFAAVIDCLDMKFEFFPVILVLWPLRVCPRI